MKTIENFQIIKKIKSNKNLKFLSNFLKLKKLFQMK